MEIKNWKHLSGLLAMIGTANFIICTSLAMIFYGGGNAFDPSSQFYSFTENFFSDLGRVTNHTGGSNIVSCVLFMIGVSGVGVLVIPMFIALPAMMQKKSISQILSAVGALIGIFSAICYIGIGFTPYDVLGGYHGTFVMYAFVSALFMVLFVVSGAVIGKEFPNRYALALVIFEVILGWYVYNMFFGPDDIIFQVVAQKIVVYAEIIALFITGYGVWKIEKDRE